MERRVMMHTEIAFANERAIIADMLINLLTNVRLTYLPDLEPADAHELLLTGAHVLIAQLGSQPATAAEISRVIGRPRDVVTQRLDELIERGYVEHRGNRYEMTTKFNVPNLQRQMRSSINIIKAAAKHLGGCTPVAARVTGPTLLASASEVIEAAHVRWCEGFRMPAR